LTTTSGFDGWDSWSVINASIVESANKTVLVLDSDYKYQFKLRTYDTAGNTDDSNPVTVAVDQEGARFELNDTGHSKVGPFAWTNLSDPAINATITDIVGMDNASIVMNVSNTSGSWERLVNITGVSGWNKSTYTVQKDESLTLTHDQTYNVTVNATDLFGETSFLFWNFQTDRVIR
jgi:hypothetical protein